MSDVIPGPIEGFNRHIYWLSKLVQEDREPELELVDSRLTGNLQLQRW